MLINILYIIIFFIGIVYLTQYRLNLKKAIHLSKNALFPSNKEEFSSIILPVKWREMEPLTKGTKSYQYVHWGTIIDIILLCFLLWVVLATDWLSSSFLSISYLFFIIIYGVKHQANLFILSDGIVLYGRYYSSRHIKHYKVEKIIRWHDLYGLDSKINNGYKLSFNITNKLFQADYVVIKDHQTLEKLTGLLEKQGITELKIDTMPDLL